MASVRHKAGGVGHARGTRRPIVHWSQIRFGFAVLLPIMAWFVIFLLAPIVETVWLSFRRFNSLNLSIAQFTGFDNYVDVVTDSRFLTACRNSGIYLLLMIVLVVPIAVVLAVVLERTRHRQFYIFAFYLPGVMSALATAVLFRFLYDPNLGLFNQALQLFHIPKQSFIYSPKEALVSLALMDAWKSFGFYTIILMAGLVQIPNEYREASSLDGANAFRHFWYVTLPLIRPIILLVVFMVTVTSLQVFTSAYGVSAGSFGPEDALLMLSGLIYETGIQSTDIGFAGATSVILFLAIVVVTLGQFRLLRPRAEAVS